MDDTKKAGNMIRRKCMFRFFALEISLRNNWISFLSVLIMFEINVFLFRCISLFAFVSCRV